MLPLFTHELYGTSWKSQPNFKKYRATYTRCLHGAKVFFHPIRIKMPVHEIPIDPWSVFGWRILELRVGERGCTPNPATNT